MIKNSSFTGGSFQWQCGRNLHHGILMLLHMYPGSTLASYKSLPKNAYRETSYINTGIKKKSPPPEQKIIQQFNVVSIPMPLSLVFFPPVKPTRFFGSKLLENGDPKKERFGDQTGPPWGLRRHVRCKDTSLRDVTFIVA